MILRPEELATATGGTLLVDGPSGPVRTDSRRLGPGDWFLALGGERFDGHDFLPHARAAGCAGAVAERVPEAWDRGFVRVQDTLRALQDCASYARQCFRGPVVGITGSSGKTTTRAMIATVLGQAMRVHQTQGNLNNHIGLPLTLLDAPVDAEAWVVELGMSAPGEIHRLQEISRPTVRVITNVAAAHLEGVGDLDGVARCKQELFDGARSGDQILVNLDDPRVAQMSLPEGLELRVLRYGESHGCDVSLTAWRVEPRTLSTLVQIQTPRGTVAARLVAPGEHIALDALAAAAVGVALGLEPEAIAAGLRAWEPVGMRMRVDTLPGGVTVLNDAYNANPASARAALQTLAALPGRRIALLGDMLELGSAEAEAHREVCTLAGQLGLDLVGLAGPRMGAAADAVVGAGEVLVAGDAAGLAESLRGRLLPGDVVLVKGSRGARMERVLQQLRAEDT